METRPSSPEDGALAGAARRSDLPGRDDRSLLARVFQDVPVPIMVTDTTPAIIGINRAFSRVTGYPPAEVLGRNPRILASGHHDRDFYARMWEAIIVHGTWEGEIWNRRRDGATFPEILAITASRDAHGTVTHYIGTFRDITSRKEREARLEHLSQHDVLTSLPNRLLFRDRLLQAMRRARRMGRQIAVLFLDLDRFKEVNDTSGHAAGDRVLQDVGARLSRIVRDMDTVARVGGDEFAILLTDFEARAQIETFAARVLDHLSKAFEVSGRSHALGASIGIALGPQPDDDPDRLMERADSSMYLAKRSGGRRFVFAPA